MYLNEFWFTQFFFVFSLIVKGVSTRMMAKYISSTEIKKGAKSRDITSMNNDIELYSNIISLMSAEVVFYPFETILHRIQLQGTRTIIDNLDSGEAKKFVKLQNVRLLTFQFL